MRNLRYVLIKASELTNEMVNRSTTPNLDAVRRATFREPFLHFFEKDVEYVVLKFSSDNADSATQFINEYWMTHDEIEHELQNEKVEE